jgi:DNA-directed RNA polymerase subunit RPC12/RpoP
MVTREEAKQLCRGYRSNRAGIRNNARMVSVCLICESIHVVPVTGSVPPAMKCQNCGFEFIRYSCWNCGETVDGRDPGNPACRECGWRICSCLACSSAECSSHRQRLQEADRPG